MEVMPMFTNTVNYHTVIRSLIDQYQGSKDIVKLLEDTQQFLTKTAPEFQAKRDAAINDLVIKAILDELASKIGAAKQKTTNKEFNQVLAVCIDIVNGRLNELETNHDKIFTYYKQNDNALKTLLASSLSKQLNNGY
jgi:NTP pyrophosphatase (non-canonical NTP hydrolase)